MKFTFFVMLWAFIFALVCAGVCPPVAADIWTSGKVVYTTNAYGDLDIEVMGPDGEHVASLTSSTDYEWDPTWSPDGTEVLYVRDSSGAEVWLMDADGDNQRSILSFGDSPSWAPDGNRFVARDHWDDALYIYTLNEARDDWDDFDTITSSGHPTSPAWSPDGNYIAYIRGGAADAPWTGGSLYVYDVAADRSTKIVSGSPGRFMSNPTWGPQSYRILFAWENAGFTNGNRAIFAVGRDGADLRWTHSWDDYYIYHPTVAPYGGESIVARHDPSTGNRDLYKVTRRTNNWLRLDPDSGTYNDDADWWHPSFFSVEPGASQLTTTWGDLKKKAR